MGCSNSKELQDQIREVQDLLAKVDANDIESIKKVLAVAWQVFQHLNSKDKEKIIALSKKCFA